MGLIMKQMLVGSIIAAVVVLGIVIFDLALGFPFNRFSMLMDIMFMIGAGLVIYMGWDSMRQMR
jgi:hypothetical protein